MAATTEVKQPTKSLGAEIGQRVRANLQTITIVLAWVAILVIFSILAGLDGKTFLSPQNVSNLFRQMTVTSFLAMGMVFVIVTGNIDLSVGKLAGFVSVVAAYFQATIWYKLIPDQPILAAALSVIVGLLVGTLAGVLQGSIIAYLRVPAFIVTLGGMFILTGLILLVTQGKTIPANQPGFSFIAQGYLPPIVGWILAALIVVFLFWNMFRSRQRKTKYGFELSESDDRPHRNHPILGSGHRLHVSGQPIPGPAVPGAVDVYYRRCHVLCCQQHANSAAMLTRSVATARRLVCQASTSAVLSSSFSS